MRVAVIGGGAAGLCAAWLLDPAHEVTLFEAAPVLGGHVRTLGGNVPCAALPQGVRLDAGVIEFDRRTFTAFHAWMEALGVACVDLEGGATSLYLADGRHLHSPDAIALQGEGVAAEARDLARLVPLAVRRRRFLRRTAPLTQAELAMLPVARLLADDDFSTWVRALLMYAYSMHYDDVARMSAALAVPMLRDFLLDARWTHIPAGVHSYVDAARASMSARVLVDAPVRAVRRGDDGVTVTLDGARERFDAVVLAVPPHRVLSLLVDASEDERRWFGGYEGAEVTTVVHTDTGPYARRGVRGFTEFDLFELPDGTHGYNAYLNRLAGLPDDVPPHYSLAFDLDAELDPARVIHRQRHDVPRHTELALRHRGDLLARNGERATWFVGAWLGDGLHEGAVRSAAAVAARLGGRALNAGARGGGRP